MTHTFKRSRAAGLAIELAHIDLVRDGRRVLRDLAWRIRPGERWVLRGENGAGKTQLLKLLAGDVWPQPTARARRSYWWRGERCDEPQGVRERIAYLGAERQDRYQHYEWNHRVRTIVGTGLQRTDVPLAALRGAQRAQVNALLRRLGIEQWAGRRFLALSYGERRLVLLARALAWRPDLLLLDEPLNGLDADNRRRMLQALAALRRSRVPWVFATHRLEEVPRGVTHQAVLARGCLTVIPRVPRARALRERSGAGSGALGARVARVAGGRRPPQRPALLELKNGWVWRGGRAVLRAATLRLERGDCWVVHGPNGSGKSTLLAALYGEVGIADRGSLWRRAQASGEPLRRFQRRDGRVAPELQAALPRQQTALECVIAGLRTSYGLDGVPSRIERARARRALAHVGAARLRAQPTGTLSYGQMRRVLFARALALRPDILLLDEPYTGLDVRTRAALRALLEGRTLRGMAIVMATHHRDDWPARTSHELQLRAGAVRYAGVLRAENKR